MNKFFAWLYGGNLEGVKADVYCPNCGKRLTYSVKPKSYDMMTGKPTSFNHSLLCLVYDGYFDEFRDCYKTELITETKDYPLEWRNGDF